ncbi:type 4a pilus biogenesis protein PilO [Paenibacillus sp. NFR01]|uniref:type 4a pilus biogenesis protein PilO n=1 Tax=Paenibacillus sp. NFR01 TaxID=1566279 RepID=UPI0008B44A15|nr:type 4a pilus biogenesis protein PilO [Paenibacillus sp. NFR01]SEU14770.1 type IV pilus assembly protein PilO [Paenibacillus sp. NFR01]
MEQINKYRSSIVLGLLILFLLLLAFYMLGIRPVNNDMEARDAEVSLLQRERDALENKINELQTAAGSPDADETPLLAAIPRGDDTESLIRSLQTISQNSYARLKDIGFSLADNSAAGNWAGLGQATAGLNEIKMSAVVEGRYGDIHEWLKELNDMPRIISIDSFTFQQPYQFPTATNPGSVLTANVAFTAYYEAPTAAADTAAPDQTQP